MSTSETNAGLSDQLGNPIRSLKGKFGILALLIAVALLATGVVVYTTTSGSLTSDAQGELQSSAASQSSLLHKSLENLEGQAAFTATAAPVQSGSPSEASAFLTSRLENGVYSHVVTGVHLVDTTDRTVVASSGDAAGIDLSAMGVTMPAGEITPESEDELLVSKVFGESEDEMRLALFRSVPGQDTVVMLVVDAMALSAELSPPVDGDTYLVHPDTEQIVLSTKADHIGGTVSEHNVINDDQLSNTYQTYGAGDADHSEGGEHSGEEGDHSEGGEHSGEEGEHSEGGEHSGEEGEHSDGGEHSATSATYLSGISHHGNTQVAGATVVEGSDLVLVTQVSQSQAFGLRSTVFETLGIGAAVLAVALLAVGLVVRRTTADISDLSERAARVSDGEFDVDVDSDRSDEVGQLYDDIDEMRDSLRSRIEEAERLRRESERLTEHLQAAAREYGDTMQACAEGDLTRRIDPDEESESMRTVAEEFNDAVTELERAVHETRTFTDEVATVAEQIDERSDGVADASGQVADSVDRISDGAARQSDSLQSVLAEMQDLSSTVEEIASTSNGVASRADRAATQSRETRATAEDALDGLEEVRARTRTVVETFERLDDRVDDVARLVDEVGTIATQTNRLALNANIEASRAETSEDGGFAAVADEIRDLADESKTAAEEAEAILEALRADARESAETVDQAATEIDDHAETFGDVVSAVDDLGRLAEETSAGMDEISAATEQQAAAAEEVVSMIEDVAAIAEETSAETQTVAAAAQQQSAAASDLSESGSRLATTAADLADTVDEFETRPADGSGTAPADD